MEDRNVDKSITDVLERSYRILRLANGNMKTNEECGLMNTFKTPRDMEMYAKGAIDSIEHVLRSVDLSHKALEINGEFTIRILPRNTKE